MLNYTDIEGDKCNSQWAECKKIATGLEGILYRKDQTENSYTKILKKNPGFISNLRKFGEMGIVPYAEIGAVLVFCCRGDVLLFLI